jgi:hypothetical protein
MEGHAGRKLPLPWREGAGGRGNKAIYFTPTLTLNPSRGREVKIYLKKRADTPVRPYNLLLFEGKHSITKTALHRSFMSEQPTLALQAGAIAA